MTARRFGGSDDPCIFIDDTFSEELVGKLTSSPSAKAFLSPQRERGSGGNNSSIISDTGSDHGSHPPAPPAIDVIHCDLTGSAQKRRNRFSGRAFAADITNSEPAGKVSYAKVPTEVVTPNHNATTRAGSSGSAKENSASPQLSFRSDTSTPLAAHRPSPPPSIPMVPLSDLTKVERERDRFRKMYEHQKNLVEITLKAHQEDYDKLQAKIHEVIALSSRCEESKRYIRQLKREVLDCRQRALPLYNQAIEQNKLESVVQEKFKNIIHQQQQQFEEAMADQQQRMDAMEKLLRDVSALASVDLSNEDRTDELIDNMPTPPSDVRWDLSSLDTLLGDAYYECTALVNELRKVRRDHEKEVARRMELEKDIDRMRRDRRDNEVTVANDRRKIMLADERRAEAHAQLQSEVLKLRRALEQSRSTCEALRSGSASMTPGSGQAPSTSRSPAVVHSESSDFEEFEIHVDPVVHRSTSDGEIDC